METIDNIVCEMRELAKEVQGNSISNAYELLMGYADRIKAAVKHQFRDATKMMPHLREVTKKEESEVRNG